MANNEEEFEVIGEVPEQGIAALAAGPGRSDAQALAGQQLSSGPLGGPGNREPATEEEFEVVGQAPAPTEEEEFEVVGPADASADAIKLEQQGLDVAQKLAGVVVGVGKGAAQTVKDIAAKVPKGVAEKAAYVGSGALNVLGKITEPLTWAQRMTTGNIVRAANPELMKRVYEEQEVKEATALGRAFDELAPPVYLGTDVVLPKVKKYFADLSPEKGDALEELGTAIAFGAGIAADIATDPLTYLTLGASSAPKVLSRVAKAGEAVKEFTLPSGRTVYQTADKTLHFFEPGAKAVDAGNDLLQAKLPFSSQPFFSVKGEKVQEYMRLKQAELESSSVGKLMRSLNPRTSNDVFNAQRNIHSYEQSAAKVIANDVIESAETVMAGRPVTKDISQMATMIEEIGLEGARKAAKFKGLKLSEFDIETAQQLGRDMASWRTKASDMYQSITGEAMPLYQRSEENIAQFLAKNPQISSAIDALPADVKPFVFADTANVRRMKNPEFVRNAKRLGVELEEGSQLVNKSVKFSGLKETADTLKGREIPLSSWAYDYLMEQKTGVKDFFDPDIVRATQVDVADILRSAADQKFGNYIRESGLTLEQWEQKINAARQMVQAGVADPSIYKIAQLDPAKDLGSIEAKTLQNYGYKGKTAAGDVLLEKQPLFYEKSVADAVNSSNGLVNQNTASKFMGWANSLITRGYLTGIGRAAPQLYEATSAAIMAGLNSPRYLAQAVASTFAPDDIRRVFDASGLGDNVSNALEKGKKLVVTPAIYGNEKTYGAIKGIQEMFANRKESLSKWFDEFGELSKGQKLARGLELSVDNPFSRQIRSIVNGFENIPKEALFRQKIAEGMRVPEAMDYVGRTMLDFRFKPQNNLNSWVTFGNFHAQNLARVPFLVAKNPWVANLTDSDRGVIKRAVEGAYGWKPDQIEMKERILGPHPQETVMSGFMPGVDSIMKNPEHANNTLSGIVGFLLGKMPEESMIGQALHRTPEGFQTMHYLPTTVGGAKNFLVGSDLAMTPPIIRAGLALAGVDIVSGKSLVTPSERLESVLKSTNPMRNPNFWNLFNASMDAAAQEQFKSLQGFFDDPAYRAAMRIVGGSIAERTSQEDMPSQAMLKSLVQSSTFGLFRLTQPDVSYRVQVGSTIKELKELRKKIIGASMTKEKLGVPDLLARERKTQKELRDTIRFYDAYRRGVEAIRSNPETSKALLPPDNTSVFTPKMDNEDGGPQ